MTEIETLAELDAAVERARRSSHSMRGWQVQGLDLTDHLDALAGLDPRGALFLGCTMPEATASMLRAGGALVFPEVPDVPFDPWRGHLYTPDELYAGLERGYDHTADARIYAWSQRRSPQHDLRRMLAASLHDSSIDDALGDLVHGRRVVGVMGGHAWTRTDPSYADAAHLAHGLAARGLTVATGGGPGAMEAANLGARLSGESSSTLDGAVEAIGAVPSYRPGVTAWARVGLDATAGLTDSGRSLGLPTWHYGHEPPNVFSCAIAKYFRNAIREDVLLEVCRDGIVFLPGAAGTVQEIFQATCSNYYAPDDQVVPMVFVGEEHWTETLPAWPLVDALTAGRPVELRPRLVGTTEEALRLLVEER